MQLSSLQKHRLTCHMNSYIQLENCNASEQFQDNSQGSTSSRKIVVSNVCWSSRTSSRRARAYRCATRWTRLAVRAHLWWLSICHALYTGRRWRRRWWWRRRRRRCWWWWPRCFARVPTRGLVRKRPVVGNHTDARHHIARKFGFGWRVRASFVALCNRQVAGASRFARSKHARITRRWTWWSRLTCLSALSTREIARRTERAVALFACIPAWHGRRRRRRQWYARCVASVVGERPVRCELTNPIDAPELCKMRWRWWRLVMVVMSTVPVSMAIEAVTPDPPSGWHSLVLGGTERCVACDVCSHRRSPRSGIHVSQVGPVAHFVHIILKRLAHELLCCGSIVCPGSRGLEHYACLSPKIAVCFTHEALHDACAVVEPQDHRIDYAGALSR